MYTGNTQEVPVSAASVDNLGHSVKYSFRSAFGRTLSELKKSTKG